MDSSAIAPLRPAHLSPVLVHLSQLAIRAAFFGSLQALFSTVDPYTFRERFAPSFKALRDPKNWHKVLPPVFRMSRVLLFSLPALVLVWRNARPCAGSTKGSPPHADRGRLASDDVPPTALPRRAPAGGLRPTAQAPGTVTRFRGPVPCRGDPRGPPGPASATLGEHLALLAEALDAQLDHVAVAEVREAAGQGHALRGAGVDEVAGR